MTRRVVVTPQAARDIDRIVRTSRRDFGDDAALRYRDLISVGIAVLGEDARPRTARLNHALAGGSMLFHLRYVNQTARPAVRNPRHLLVYKVGAEDVEIVRVLHEAMDLLRHMPGKET